MRTATPYPESGYAVVWHQDSAMVWTWDAQRVRAAIQEASLDPRRVTIIPETLLQPTHTGLRLITSLDGFEGQIWHQGHLVHSRWWPALPADAEWIAFQRDSAQPPDQQQVRAPTPQAVPLEAKPWAKLRSLEGAQPRGIRDERLYYVLGALLLGLPTVWYGAWILKLSQAHDRLKGELATLEAKADPILNTRNMAYGAAARIEALEALSDYPSQLFLMSEVAQALPANGAYLKEWRYREGDLRIVIASPTAPLSDRFMVNALQSAGPFNAVQATTGGDPKMLALKMAVRKAYRPPLKARTHA